MLWLLQPMMNQVTFGFIILITQAGVIRTIQSIRENLFTKQKTAIPISYPIREK